MRRTLILIGFIASTWAIQAQDATPMVSFEVIDSCEVHHQKLKSLKVKPSKEMAKSVPDHYNPAYPHATIPWVATAESPSYQVQFVCKQCNKDLKKSKKAKAKGRKH